MARQNQLEENALKANNQLGNFYNTLANIGIDYARLNQQDLSTLLNAYNNIYSAQNSALGQLGQAVEMGSDPTVTSDSTASGTQRGTTTTTQRNGFADLLTPIIGAGINRFTAF
jgi:DNA anti-recombination protein RmuC